MHPPVLRGSLAALIPLLACDLAPEASDDLDDRQLDGDSDGEADGEASPLGNAPALPLDAEAPPVDPETILNGWVHDSDRDVMVVTPLGMCSGTLMRNDVVLTARPCVEYHELFDYSLIEDPAPSGPTWLAIQDGPGATLGTARSMVDWTPLQSNLTLVQLDAPFEIEGRTMGASTQIYGKHWATLGQMAVPCQGFGRDTEVQGTGVLRSGLVLIAGAASWRHILSPIDGYDQVQWVGDAGGSCVDLIFQPPHLRKIVGVTLGIHIAEDKKIWAASPTSFGPEVHDKLDQWAGGDLLDDFSTPEQYEVDEPATMYGGPSNWQIAGGVLTESSNAHVTANFEGTRFVNSAEVINDGGVAVTVTSPDDDGAGLVLRVRDDTHYYRFSVDEQRGFARIVRRKGNAFQTLGENLAFAIDWSTSPRLEFQASGGLLVGYVDDVVVVAAFDPDVEYTAGRVGVYQWGLTGATFDDLEIIRD